MSRERELTSASSRSIKSIILSQSCVDDEARLYFICIASVIVRLSARLLGISKTSNHRRTAQRVQNYLLNANPKPALGPDALGNNLIAAHICLIDVEFVAKVQDAIRHAFEIGPNGARVSRNIGPYVGRAEFYRGRTETPGSFRSGSKKLA